MGTLVAKKSDPGGKQIERSWKEENTNAEMWACPVLSGWLPFIGYREHCLQCLWKGWTGTTSSDSSTYNPKPRIASGSPTFSPWPHKYGVLTVATTTFWYPFSGFWLYLCVPLSLGPAFHQTQGSPLSWRYQTSFPSFSHSFPSLVSSGQQPQIQKWVLVSKLTCEFINWFFET